MAKWYLKEFEWKNSPLDLYKKLHNSEHSFFLYTSLLHNESTRFSYMSCDPYIIFTAKRDQIIINRQNQIEKLNGNPFVVFEDLLAQGTIDYQFDINIFGKHFFRGGAVGYWGYDLKDHIEKLASIAQDEPHLPDAYWAFYDGLILIDHLRNKYYLIGTEDCIRKLESKMQSEDDPLDNTEQLEYNIMPSVIKDEYIKQIGIVKEYIANGDVYEVNLSQRFNLEIQSENLWNDFNIFKSLVKTSPSPFSAFIKLGEWSVISSSPELFLKTRDRKAESKPIKGTRPRDSDFFEDEAMYLDLLNSEKDRAENVMIVDLVRNDLGRVSKTGSVEATDLFAIEKYTTVFQMVSTIKSTIADRYTCIDAIKSCFPPGSMTGAPKIRAMQIIEEIEPFKRGVYSGSLGYIGYDGSVELSVVIRTLILRGNKGHFQTGGAIVWDSVAEAEYQECLDKAEGIIKALENLRAV